MSVTIRAADPARDYPSLAELLTAVGPQITTAEALHNLDSIAFQDGFRQRLVAVDSGERIAGYAVIFRGYWMPPGRYDLWVTVDPAKQRQGIGREQRQGIGRALYEAALAFSQQQGAASWSSDIHETHPDGIGFAERRGFVRERHIFESRLLLGGFDERRFAGIIERAEATGIRFFSLAEAGDTREMRYKLWEANVRAVQDDPASDGGFLDFAGLNEMFNKARWFRPQGQFLAADGDAVIGLAAVGYFEESNSLHNMITGVDRAYRGRGIAQALKLHTIRYGLACGADYITTGNDSTNAAMLTINRKLGYQPQPGIYRMVKRAL